MLMQLQKEFVLYIKDRSFTYYSVITSFFDTVAQFCDSQEKGLKTLEKWLQTSKSKDTLPLEKLSDVIFTALKTERRRVIIKIL